MLSVSLDCVVFLFCFSPSFPPYVVSFSGFCCVFALFLSVLSIICCQFLTTQSRETGNIGYTRRRETKQKHDTIQGDWYIGNIRRRKTKQKQSTIQSNGHHRINKTERNKTKQSTIQRNWHHRVNKTEKNKTKQSTIQTGLCCVFILFFSVLSILCCQFLWIVLCFVLFFSVLFTL
jgi:Flp pilus assembly protein TadB